MTETLLPQPTYAPTMLLDTPFKQNFFRSTKPISYYIGVNPKYWGVLIQWGIITHGSLSVIWSQSAEEAQTQSCGESYLNTLK